MAGFTPNEGENNIANIIFNGANLQIGLFTNNPASLSETTVLANITEPTTQGGYARQTLTAGNWTISSGQATYPQITFQPSGNDYSSPVYGYFIVTTAGTPVLRHVHDDPNGPRTITDGVPYRINLQIQTD